MLHSFEVEALSGDFPGVAVFLKYGVELVGFTLGAGDTGLAEGFGGFFDALGVTFGAGDDVGLESAGLVDTGIPFLTGAQHIVEGVADFLGGFDILQLDGFDVNAGVVAVEDFLEAGFGLFLDFLAVADQDIVDGTLADNQAEGGFGGVFEGAAVGAAGLDGAAFLAGVVDAEQVVVEAFDVVLDDHLDVDDVEVAANHQGFGREGVAGAGGVAAETEFHTAGFGDADDVPVADGGGPPPLETFLGYRSALDGAKEAAGGVFTGADGIDAGGRPDDDEKGEDGDDENAEAAAAKAAGEAADAFAEAGGYLLEVHFGLPLAAAGWVHKFCILNLGYRSGQQAGGRVWGQPAGAAGGHCNTV